MTYTTAAVEGVIKTDVLGRMRTSAVRRETLLQEFERSGISATKFSELAGIKYQTFATWLQKRKRQGNPPAKTTDTVRWLETVVEQAQASGGKSPLASRPGAPWLTGVMPKALDLPVQSAVPA